jgi:hypothetical protein
MRRHHSVKASPRRLQFAFATQYSICTRDENPPGGGWRGTRFIRAGSSWVPMNGICSGRRAGMRVACLLKGEKQRKRGRRPSPPSSRVIRGVASTSHVGRMSAILAIQGAEQPAGATESRSSWGRFGLPGWSSIPSGRRALNTIRHRRSSRGSHSQTPSPANRGSPPGVISAGPARRPPSWDDRRSGLALHAIRAADSSPHSHATPPLPTLNQPLPSVAGPPPGA